MTTKFNMQRDIGGFNGFGIQFTDTGYQTELAANVEQHFTVPSTTSLTNINSLTVVQYLAIFSFDPGASVWVANNVTATVPGGSFSSTVSQQNPAARVVKAGDVLSFISNDDGTEVGVEFYAIA